MLKIYELWRVTIEDRDVLNIAKDMGYDLDYAQSEKLLDLLQNECDESDLYEVCYEVVESAVYNCIDDVLEEED